MIVQGDKRIMTADELETFIFQAKLQEREACAKIAEAQALEDEHEGRNCDPDSAHYYLRWCVPLSQKIAKAIRERKP